MSPRSSFVSANAGTCLSICLASNSLKAESVVCNPSSETNAAEDPKEASTYVFVVYTLDTELSQATAFERGSQWQKARRSIDVGRQLRTYNAGVCWCERTFHFFVQKHVYCLLQGTIMCELCITTCNYPLASAAGVDPKSKMRAQVKSQPRKSKSNELDQSPQDSILNLDRQNWKHGFGTPNPCP